MSEQRVSDQHPRDQRAAPRVAETGSEVRPVVPRPIILSAAKPHPVTPDDAKPAAAPFRAPTADSRNSSTLYRLAAWHGARLDAAGAASDAGERHL